MTEPVRATSITITEHVAEGDVVIRSEIDPPDAPIVTLLGMLRLTEDTILRDAAGEAPDDLDDGPDCGEAP